MLAVRVSIREFIIIHVGSADGEVVVFVIGFPGSYALQEVGHVTLQQRLPLVDLYRGGCVAGVYEDGSFANAGVLKKRRHVVGDVDELWGSIGQFSNRVLVKLQRDAFFYVLPHWTCLGDSSDLHSSLRQISFALTVTN